MAEKRLIITCMKDEGPFILEWIAYHRSIGFTDFLVFTNDCTDGTDQILQKLQTAGIVETLDNPYQRMKANLNPQQGALRYAQQLDITLGADRIMVMDVDEYLNIHVGDGRLDDLLAAADDPDLISFSWRLFGNADVAKYEDVFVTQQFEYCAPEYCPNPLQAWGVKTLFSTKGPHVAGLYKKIGVHRPLNRSGSEQENCKWVNGSGEQVLDKFLDKGWRFGSHSAGYRLATLNHYAVRSAESFLVKRDRGRVNHIERDQGLAYWLRMNFNMEHDRSIQNNLPRARSEFDRLVKIHGMKSLHTGAVRSHRAKIRELRKQKQFSGFFDEITSPELQRISRYLNLLSRQIFEDGPKEIPASVYQKIAKLADLRV